MRSLTAPPTLGKESLPHRPRKPRKVQRAPREFTFPEQTEHTGGPGDPPAAFSGAKISDTEWQPYWALARIFNQPSPRQVRNGPFIGAPGIWIYQQYIPGPATTTNIDFVVLPTNGLAKPTAFRIQTEFVHLFPVDGSKYMYDVQQKLAVSGEYDLVDIYDYMYLGDPSGASIIKLIKAGLGLIEPPNPAFAGTAQRVPR